MSATSIFDGRKTNNDVYREEECMKKFCKSLKQHRMKIINFEMKKMIPLTNKKQESYEKTKICYICKKGS